MSIDNDCRKAFEREYEADYEGDLAKYADGSYVNDVLNHEWDGWQSCWKVRQKEIDHASWRCP